jgi:formylglycine-generating enzyme required for sulfatase activity
MNNNELPGPNGTPPDEPSKQPDSPEQPSRTLGPGGPTVPPSELWGSGSLGSPVFASLPEGSIPAPLPPGSPPNGATNVIERTRATEPSSPSSSSSGSLRLSGVEGYRVLELIGRGEFGEVYRAYAPGGVLVALKRVSRSLADKNTQRELSALDKIRELRHPFLLQTHSFQSYEDRLIIVMELADGSLQDRFEAARARGLPGIPVAELLNYFAEAAEALDFLHEQKLAHRDIKPQNLLHLKGHAKVADFGVLRAQENQSERTLSAGTPLYMPPEMWNGSVSVHSDQYSFAVTWYEMRTGRRIITGQSLLEVAHQHCLQTPDLEGVSEAERQVLLRGLAKEPEKRFPSCVAFVQALRQAVEGTAPAPARRGSRHGLRAGRRLVVFGLAASLLGVSAVLALRLVGSWLAPANAPMSWQPRGWLPVDSRDIVVDIQDRRYYRRLVREVGGERVVVVVVPQTASANPPTFYIMENKVWNSLYDTFTHDPESKRLQADYAGRPGCEQLVRDEWWKGPFVSGENPDPEQKPFVGVQGANKGRWPVFRVTVTEAHCFAEWLGGRLPTRHQWRKAAGRGEDNRAGPFDGDPGDKAGLLLHEPEAGPWPVDAGDRDVSIHGCRQMASNGLEWTRDLADNVSTVPLEEMHLPRQVYILGQSYLSPEPLTFAKMNEPRVKGCTEAPFEVSFRVVLEQQ